MCHLLYREMVLSLRIGFLTEAAICFSCINHTLDALLSVFCKMEPEFEDICKNRAQNLSRFWFFSFYNLAYTFLTNTEFNSRFFLSKTMDISKACNKVFKQLTLFIIHMLFLLYFLK